MIWFGTLPGFPTATAPARQGSDGPRHEHARMQRALEWVATQAPHLTGAALVDALVRTGWVDASTASRLLPEFRHFDADRHFAENLRRISFRGSIVGAEFRAGMVRILEDLTGAAQLADIGPEEGIRFGCGQREGIMLAHPEVSFSIGGNTRDAVAAAIEEMPDVLVVVARNFQESTAQQLAGLLSRTGVPGTLVTVNLLLGMRAVAMRYQPSADRVIDLLGAGRALRSADIARLGNRA
jgi:hypothetical protein